MTHVPVKERALHALAFIAAAALLLLAVPASADDDIRTRLYADGTVSCTGADSLIDPEGWVELDPMHGGVAIEIELEDAEPNRTYTVAVSQEPNCGNPVVYTDIIRTDEDGDAETEVIYPAASGQRNILVNISTSATGLSDPRHREIATRNAIVVVP